MVRFLRAAALFLAIGAVVFALLPFHQHVDAPPGDRSLHLSCGASIAEAWHSTSERGWFGYAPLDSDAVRSAPRCAYQARQRLAASVSGLVVAAALALGARYLGRRSRLGPAPA